MGMSGTYRWIKEGSLLGSTPWLPSRHQQDQRSNLIRTACSSHFSVWWSYSAIRFASFKVEGCRASRFSDLVRVWGCFVGERASLFCSVGTILLQSWTQK